MNLLFSLFLFLLNCESIEEEKIFNQFLKRTIFETVDTLILLIFVIYLIK